jgi:hypothetical protein
VEGDWLPPQAPGSSPPPPIPAGAPAPPPPFDPPPDSRQPAAAPPPAAQDTNSEAVAAMTCGMVGAGLIYFTNGLSTVVSLTLGIVGVIYARKARRNVQEGRTARHADLTTAANIVGWITIGISILATLVWIVLIAFWGDEF